MRGHKTCLKSLTEQRSDLRGVRLLMAGQALASEHISQENARIVPWEKPLQSWVDNTLSYFKSLKTPEKQTKNPPTHLKAGGGA